MKASEPFWNNIAERYAAKPVANLDAYHAKLRATKVLLKVDYRLLDVGCGTGSLALELAPCVAHVDAVDISREMVRIANKKAADAGVDNVTFHHTAVSELPPVESQSFDAICAFNILHLVEDRTASLAKLYDLLKPGGHFISTTPCLGEGFVPFKPILGFMRLIGKAPPVEVFPIAQLEQEIRAAGFVDLSRPDVPADNTTAFVLAARPGE